MSLGIQGGTQFLKGWARDAAGHTVGRKGEFGLRPGGGEGDRRKGKGGTNVKL